MLDQNQNIDLEATDYNRQEDSVNSFTEEEYLIEVLNRISPAILSDEFYEKNKDLIRGISDGFYDRHMRRGDMPPILARRSIEIILSSVAKFGWR